MKTDKVDAKLIRTMAEQGHGDLFTLTNDTLELQSLVAQRHGLVEIRANLKCRLEAHTWRKKLEGGMGIPSHEALKETLAFVCGQIKALEKYLEQTQTPIQQLLRSIPGIGVGTAAALVANIGNIQRFSSPKKLVAYLGLDPRVHESGTSVHGKGYLSKRGNKRLRSLLFNAAFISKRYIPELHDYYEKKHAEGQHHFSALCATERKLVHLIHAVWTRGTPFEPRV